MGQAKGPHKNLCSSDSASDWCCVVTFSTYIICATFPCFQKFPHMNLGTEGEMISTQVSDVVSVQILKYTYKT